MNTQPFTFSLLLLGALSGAGAQSLPVDGDSLSTRPLNLSVRQQTVLGVEPTLTAVGKDAQDTSKTLGTAASGNDDERAVVRLPYGAGYESRQRGNTTGSGSAGSSGGSGAGGSGAGGSGSGGGRGGSGRGR